MGHQINPTILREYDIRGIVGETLSTDDARAIGQSYGTALVRAGGSKVCVGYDGRLSSPDMEAALVEGLMSTGLTVLRVGRGPSPMLYFATYALQADGGIMVTGSHNPPTHNGFKMLFQGKPFFGGDIKELGARAAAGDFEAGEGSSEDHPQLDAYVARMGQDVEPGRDLTIVWDCGNGAAGEAVTNLVPNLPGTHIVLFGDIDGTFPNHHPDPTVPKNLEDLKAAVAEHQADIGFAFDGDGDRIGVIDGKGRILWGDQILVILAEAMLKDHPAAPIIADVKASRVLFDEVTRMGGQAEMFKTGHSLIKNRMAELKSPLAGEMSGHIFFADKYYGFDDALYAAVRFMNIVASYPDGQSLANRFDQIPKMINTPEVRFDCADDRKFDVVKEVTDRLDAAGADYSAVDGARVSAHGGWWLLRASNTQAVLVARCEAPDEESLIKLKADLAAQLEASGLTPPAF